ncbi:MAG: glycosyltransferase family 2 protein [Deltaproteobacteria bacterium]|nr:MAG: glycosyltransferase family 2 protein [Deltaproteobacteria bacterium]
MPLFSVVLPTYNRAHILEETIQSVLDQTCTDWELIVVDDGSKDNTQEVVSRIAEKDARIKYVFQQNAERSVARNNGVAHSIGKYVCFLDSDDLFLSNHLEILKNEIELQDKPVALFFTNHRLLQGDEIKDVSILKYDGSPDYFIFHPVIPARFCIHAQIFETYQFDLDSIVVEDAILCTYIALDFQVVHIEKVTVLYRWHEENSVNIKNDAFTKRLRGLRKLFSDQKVAHAIPKRTRNIALSRCNVSIAKHHAFHKRKGKAIGTLIGSLMRFPNVAAKEKVYLLLQLVKNKPIH